MPNRIIKESICTSDTIDKLTAEEERFFYRLVVQADDFGRFDGRAPVVLAGCFPLRSHEIPVSQVEAWLNRLAEVDLIRFYYVDGRRYLLFTTWDKHQQKRAKHSKYPDPPADDEHVISNDIRRESHDCKCPRESRSENTRIEKRESTDETRAHTREAAATLEPPLPAQHASSVGPSGPLVPVFDAYRRHLGIMGPSVTNQLVEWHQEHQMEPALLAEAIEITAKTKTEQRIRGSPDRYLNGVIRGFYNDGIKTMDDLRAKQGPQTQEEAADYILDLLAQSEEGVG